MVIPLEIFVMGISSSYILLSEAIFVVTAIIHEQFICPIQSLHCFLSLPTDSAAMPVRVVTVGQSLH